MPQDWIVIGALTRKGGTVYISVDGLRCKVTSAKSMGDGDVDFEQKADRLVLRGLREAAPDEPATVVELKVEGDPVHELGAGHVLRGEV